MSSVTPKKEYDTLSRSMKSQILQSSRNLSKQKLKAGSNSKLNQTADVIDSNKLREMKKFYPEEYFKRSGYDFHPYRENEA